MKEEDPKKLDPNAFKTKMASDQHSKVDSSNSKLILLLLWWLLILSFNPGLVRAGCPFQNPFWFVEKPMVVPVMDDQGESLPNKVRIMWGRMENFKCVDYFQVHYNN